MELRLHIMRWIRSNKCECFEKQGVRECEHQITDFQKKFGKESHQVYVDALAERGLKPEDV